MALAAGQQLGDNLVLERELGSGGMGTVWLAQNRALGSHVAVKVLRASGDAVEVARQRFEQEARGVAQIDHPHVVKVFDYGMTPAGEPYLVMELLRGEDLSQRLERLNRLSLAETVSVIGQASKALGRAHEQGIVHRDIKPANIFLLDVDGEVFVKVLDFGIAKYRRSADMAMTETGAVMGTPYFMSPEQIVDAKEIDHRCDLWALGVVAYCCLAGDVPFHGQSVGALSIAIHQGVFAPVRHLRPDLPEGIDLWLSRALAKLPEQRFQSARELAEALAWVGQGATGDASRPASPAGRGPAATPMQAGQVSATLANADTYLAPAPVGAAGAPAITSAAGMTADPAPQATWANHSSGSQEVAASRAAAAQPARNLAWVWLLAGIGVAALLAAGVGAGWYFLRDDRPAVASGDRKRPRAAEERRDKRSRREDTEPAGSASASPPPTQGKSRWPAPPRASAPAPADSDAPASARNVGAGKAAVAGCWSGNEGASGAGTAASSVSVTVSFTPRDSVASVVLGGPASAYTAFRSCAVARLSSTSFGPGEAASVSWSQSLPASPPKK